MSPPDVVRFSCPHCQASLGVRRGHTGRQFRCPRCGRPVTSPSDPLADSSTAGGGEAPGDRRPVAPEESRDVPVVCRVCLTRMYAPVQWVGKTVRCPDCHTENQVVAPKKAKARSAPQWTDEDDQQYRLREDSSQPPLAAEPWIPVVCEVCGTRMHAAPDQIGQKIVCPDCGVATLVRAPRAGGARREKPHARNPLDLLAPGDAPRPDDLQLAPDSAAPALAYSHAQDLLHEAEAKIRELEEADPLRAIESEGVAGRPVFTYPFRWPMVLLWIGLTAGIWLIFILLYLVFAWPDLRAVLVGALMLAVGTFSLLGFIATHLVSIIYNTSEGYDEIVHWPENHVIDWILDGMYFASAASFAFVPWAGLHWLQAPPVVRDALGGLLFFLLFPVLFLSLLESGSRLLPFSDLVLGTLRTNWGEWIRFYGRSGAVVGLCAAVGGVDLAMGGPGAVRVVIAALLAAAVATLLMVYSRALGILVLACNIPRPAEPTGQGERDEEPEVDPVRGVV